MVSTQLERPAPADPHHLARTRHVPHDRSGRRPPPVRRSARPRMRALRAGALYVRERGHRPGEPLAGQPYLVLDVREVPHDRQPASDAQPLGRVRRQPERRRPRLRHAGREQRALRTAAKCRSRARRTARIRSTSRTPTATGGKSSIASSSATVRNAARDRRRRMTVADSEHAPLARHDRVRRLPHIAPLLSRRAGPGFGASARRSAVSLERRPVVAGVRRDRR